MKVFSTFPTVRHVQKSPYMVHHRLVVQVCLGLPVLWRDSPICQGPEAAASEAAPSSLSAVAAAWSPPRTESRSPPDGTNTPAYCHHLHRHTVTTSGDVTDSEPVWHLKKWLVSSLLVNKKMFQGVTKMFDGDSKIRRVIIQWQFYNYRKSLRYLFKLYL